jgi:hypothetical protein
MVEIIFYACIVNDGTWWKLEDSSNSKKPVQITVPVHVCSKNGFTYLQNCGGRFYEPAYGGRPLFTLL